MPAASSFVFLSWSSLHHYVFLPSSFSSCQGILLWW
ncbi:hypothetical protein OROMI_002546 [Orobanche minor]